VNGVTVRVEARLEWFDFSAHVGRKEIENFVKRFPPTTKIIFVHTDPLFAAPLIRRLAQAGYDNIYLPTAPGDEVQLGASYNVGE
jgi:Predicted exonuclease of the beta-lactamase fold involved in RNA processing